MILIDKPQRKTLERRSFLAASLGFNPGAKPRVPFEILVNFDSIADNVRNILFFRKGDYLDDPDFGVGLQDYLFDNQGEQFTLPLQQEIRRQIGRYEKRVVIRLLHLFTPQNADDTVVIDMDLLVSGFQLNGLGTAGGNFTLQQGGNR